MPAITAPHTPKARARSSPRNVAFIVDKVVGRIMAPPIPWTARDAIRAEPSTAIPAVTLDAAKTTTPTMNTVRRPIRSATLPKVSRRAAKTMA